MDIVHMICNCYVPGRNTSIVLPGLGGLFSTYILPTVAFVRSTHEVLYAIFPVIRVEKRIHSVSFQFCYLWEGALAHLQMAFESRPRLGREAGRGRTGPQGWRPDPPGGPFQEQRRRIALPGAPRRDRLPGSQGWRQIGEQKGARRVNDPLRLPRTAARGFRRNRQKGSGEIGRVATEGVAES